jgi:ferredoxin
VLKLHVDRSVCDLHTQCVLVAPELFDIDDAGELRYVADVAPELADKAREAMRLCPSGAIELHDSSE